MESFKKNILIFWKRVGNSNLKTKQKIAGTPKVNELEINNWLAVKVNNSNHSGG